jgi:hypothetical protein
MSKAKAIRFVITDTHHSAEERLENAVDAIIDQFIPSVATVAEINYPALAARLMLELGVVVGACHDSKTLMQLASDMVNCLNDGNTESQNQKLCDSMDEKDKILLDMECPSIFH